MLCCSGKNRRWLWTAAFALVALVAAGYYFKWPIVTNYWWFLIILLCPLMHLFMMGHGGHGDHEGHEEHGGGTGEKSGSHDHEPEKGGHSCCH